MLQIKVFGPNPPCPTCKRAKAQAQEAAEPFADQVEVVALDALGPEAEAYGLITTPLVVVGDEVVSKGKVAPASELAAAIERQLAA